jgi:hypothetical protein
LSGEHDDADSGSGKTSAFSTDYAHAVLQWSVTGECLVGSLIVIVCLGAFCFQSNIERPTWRPER